MDTYRAEKARAGHDPDALVRLALWCEERGLTSERLRNLSLAVLYRPDHELARGLMGLVNYQGMWKRPEDVRAVEESDPETRKRQQEYLVRRARARQTADSQLELARWCDQNGLADQAAAHYRSVVRLDPDRAAAWKRLGYEKSGKGWARPADIAAAKAEAAAQRQADRGWRPKLEKYREALAGKDAQKRRRAEEALDAISDPRAVPMIWAVLVRDDAGNQLRAVDAMAHIEGPGASNALAAMAVFSEFSEVRGRAAQILARRDPREFIASLLDLVRRPFRIRANANIVPGTDFTEGVDGHVLAEGDEYNLARTYRYQPNRWLSDIPPRMFSPEIPFLGGLDPQRASLALAFLPARNNALDPQALAIRRDLQIADRIGVVQQGYERVLGQLQQDVASLEMQNRQIGDLNGRVLQVLKLSTGRDFGDDRQAWKRWWHDQEGEVFESTQSRDKPTYSDFVIGTGPSIFDPQSHGACFVSGTPVHSRQGPAAIESIQVGDQVLSQDVRSGRMSYRAVIAVHRNAPSSTVRLTLGDEAIVATGIHRFWKPGTGWIMARDLKVGDMVRTIGGTSRVRATEPGPTAPVFNLEVAENRDFFVGKAGFLVYDYSLVRPAVDPFDAPTRHAE